MEKGDIQTQKDIQSREDIQLLITRFYEKVTRDETLGYIFNDVMKVNWEAHLPVMYDFWETVLLNATKYPRNAMSVHFDVNRKVKLEEKHFNRWLELFNSTIHEHFKGEVADLAIKRAKSIAELLSFKMNEENKKEIR